MHLNSTWVGGTSTLQSNLATTATTMQTTKLPTAMHSLVLPAVLFAFKSITAKAMLRASESDGLVKLDVAPKDPCPKAPQQPKCLVALVVAEG